MSRCEKKVEDGKKVTLEDIRVDLNNDEWDALYYASEEQIDKLIDRGQISEDFSARYQDYQEEMRCLIAEAQQEFGG